jgi:hypothetical protein
MEDSEQNERCIAAFVAAGLERLSDPRVDGYQGRLLTAGYGDQIMVVGQIWTLA